MIGGLPFGSARNAALGRVYETADELTDAPDVAEARDLAAEDNRELQLHFPAGASEQQIQRGPWTYTTTERLPVFRKAATAAELCICPRQTQFQVRTQYSA